MNCILCDRRKGERPKYCSIKCIKKAWYMRNHEDTNSSFFESSAFWDTETGFGFMWEQYAAVVMGATHLEFNNVGADLDWNGKSVDVKACNLFARKLKRGKPYKGVGGWVFNRNKFKNVDFFFCICLKENRVFKRLLIPGKLFPRTGITIGRVSKYDEFIV